MKKYFNEGHLGLIFGVAAFTYFLYTGLTRDKITSDNDLVEIKGKYLKHSFVDNEGFKNFTHQYYIWTENYSNTFQIKADYLRFFDKQDFSTTINQGEDLTLTIPKTLNKKLNLDNNVFVTSIESKTKIYLNKKRTLELEKSLASSNADYFFGTGYLISGLFLYLRRRFRLAKTTANKVFMSAAGTVWL